MQSIARDSDESSDDEFFDAHGRRAPGGGWLKVWGVWTEVAVTHGNSGVNSTAQRTGGEWCRPQQPRAGRSLVSGVPGAWQVRTADRSPRKWVYSQGAVFPGVNLFPQEAS